MSKVTLIIAAGGTGKRIGDPLPKQFIEIAGKPIIVHTLAYFYSNSKISDIIISIHKDWESHLQKLLNENGFSDKCRIVLGGISRQDSIKNALDTITDSDIVMIHDAVRPFVTDRMIDDLIKASEKFGAALPGLTPVNTIKILCDKNTVRTTPERSQLTSVQTPQAFKLDVIRNANENAYSKSYLGTDDASLVEFAGYEVKVVEGNELNIKITRPIDLVLAEEILKRNSL